MSDTNATAAALMAASLSWHRNPYGRYQTSAPEFRAEAYRTAAGEWRVIVWTFGVLDHSAFHPTLSAAKADAGLSARIVAEALPA